MTSPYLNREPRTIEQARADRAKREQFERDVARLMRWAKVRRACRAVLRFLRIGR